MKRTALILTLALLSSTACASELVTIKSAAGATARVAASAASKFQEYINALEARGATIRFMGGIRSGRCSIPSSKHPCGMALDVCQTSRGVVDRLCRLPSRSEVVKIAAGLGLLEGGAWCNSDYGHVEIRTARQADACGTSHTFTARSHKIEQLISTPALRAEPGVLR